jgi:site-specific recombinase XerD
MTPPEKKTTTESLALYQQTLTGKNYASPSIKAYLSDLSQFIEWLKTRRVDWDIPYRIERLDIVGFINFLATRKLSAVTRKRKLTSIRSFLKFCKDNQIIFGNPGRAGPGDPPENRV